MMSYEKFIMYLNTIPNYKNKSEEEEEDNKNKPAAKRKTKASGATGSFNLFDFDQR